MAAVLAVPAVIASLLSLAQRADDDCASAASARQPATAKDIKQCK